MQQLHLYFDPHMNGYCVNMGPRSDSDASYTLGIKRDQWQEKDKAHPYTFVRIEHEDGDWWTLMTPMEWELRLQDVEEHEGTAIRRVWEESQEHFRVMNRREMERFDEAERRFLAFIELGLDLPIMHGPQFVNPRPQLSEAAQAKIAEISNAEQMEG